ncbi:ribonuclease H-like protein [Serendipita vermifera]|nr:ribonuclease H-like protein [Serendipita vermifera]
MSSKTPSGNWLSLKRTLASTTSDDGDTRPHKKRKTTKPLHLEVKQKHRHNPSDLTANTPTKAPLLKPLVSPNVEDSDAHKPVGDPDSKENLIAMILRPTAGEPLGKPTKFLALDCEMVGVGPFGSESALARVTVVNYIGDVVLDEFVLPQETVTDWRTFISGIRKEDMAHAKPFHEVQKMVSDLLEDRFLVGHALSNDLQALLLSHPWLKTRDTQGFQPFKALTRTKRPGLRKLVKAVFDIEIQKGEHNPVVDARAPMALYRLYRKEWESKGTIKKPVEVTIPPSESPGSLVNKPSGTTITAVTGKSNSRSTSPRNSPAPSVSSPRSQDISVQKTKKEGLLGTTGKSLPKNHTKNGLDAQKKPSVHKKKQTGISSGLSVIVTHKNKSSHKAKLNAKQAKVPKGKVPTEERKPTADTRETSGGWWSSLGS